MRLDEMSFRDLVDELPLLPFSKRLLLIAVLWLVFLVLGYVLFWKDSLTISTQLETNIQESLGRLDAQSQLLLDRPVIEAELAELEAQLPLLKMALPSERELASLLARINDVILDHELKLSEFTPKEPLNREVMRVVPVTVSVRGDGDAISRLPNHIAALSRQVSLKEFDMAYLPDEGGWQMTGELNAFAQLPTNTPPVEEVKNP
ncbi:MAG: type 4a pilus biogenesis protein PilO [Limnobacter sp.]|jgi:type IV pilus assembly protein PilO|uniref:type 4a pilus biogenesis protein PilO n=1 Tax=unclassified Limnobacter TaxID=2630203 RepID=UPI0025C020DA|nr:type 4a pilus biogenesis protein PilO [Limnobacter sp. CACIAM 66H1]